MLGASQKSPKQNVTPSTTSVNTRHPRRLPAPLSVSICHGTPDLARKSPPKQHSEEERHSGDSVANAQKWFDKSNKHPQATQFDYQDNEPPYFLPQNSSRSSNDDSVQQHSPYRANRSPVLHTANGSSVDDFRSVIDDLTIENKKLKEKLRRYEKVSNSHLDKDKLFELKIHALPSRKRRELENTLRQFAFSLDESTDDTKSKVSPHEAAYSHLGHGTGSSSKHPSSLTSNSRLVDSGYTSMSNSAQNSSSVVNQVRLEGKLPHQTQAGKEQSVQNYLHNIPVGLLPKHSPVLTERQKKKIVVQRLEQLFTGKQGAVVGEHNQHVQQQEVSRSAAMADKAADHSSTVLEGHREAPILPYKTEVDISKPAKLPNESSAETRISRGTDSSNDNSSGRSSPQQRPTRPLDLDPDRAQIPSENIEYIRHLGLSTPQLASEDSTDSAADAEGWIFLNLLINMAQLHIINVTPDFVRTAVSEVSQNFQLSADGKQVRWRGGCKGTQISSDNGTSSARHDDDSVDDIGSRKRRKLHVGRFQPVPLKFHDSAVSALTSKSAAFHYKPLFYHNRSFSGDMSTDESDSLFDRSQRYDNTASRLSGGQHIWDAGSRVVSKGKRRHEEGSIVFYSGAKFCTDLSRDEGLIIPLDGTAITKDGYSNNIGDIIGSEQKPKAPGFSRTDSGSLLPFRPFKDYSKGPSFLEIRPKTPDPLTSGLEQDWFVNELPKNKSTWKPLQKFEASGIGGTQPADHFALRVETTRIIPTNSSSSKLSKFSAPGLNSRKFRHRISQSSLKSFHDTEESITARLVALKSLSSPATPSYLSSVESLPIEAEILSTKLFKLQPSQLPPPLGYHTSYSTSSLSDSDSDSEASGDSYDISYLRHDWSYLNREVVGLDIPTSARNHVSSEGDDESEDDEGGDVEESSIDILAPIRDLDPEMAMQKEAEFEMELEGE